VRCFADIGAETGVLSADLSRTLAIYPKVKCFSTKKGRLAAILSGVRWSDVVVVGGGELLQDRSSLLYSPFNLTPLLLARIFRRRAFCWAVGIGRSEELARTTPALAKFALRVCSGITVRDRSSHDTLIKWGFSSPVLKIAADSALTLGSGYSPGPVGSDVLGVAPRNVLNRQGRLLPLEMRRKLPGFRPEDPSSAVFEWAKVLDRHLGANGGSVLFFPFHTGTLSNDDGEFCKRILDAMKLSHMASIATFDTVPDALALMARCRVMITTPLHGAILSVVAGALPVAVSYSSKCDRFMEMAGLGDLVIPGAPGVPGPEAVEVVQHAWDRCGPIWESLAETRQELISAAGSTSDHFTRMITEC
jgi:polysaccharide pyruvyl transferase WcaK-like protein